MMAITTWAISDDRGRKIRRDHSLFQKGPLAIERDPVPEIAVRLLAGQGVTEPTLAQIRNMTGALRPRLDKHTGKTVERVGEGMPAPSDTGS